MKSGKCFIMVFVLLLLTLPAFAENREIQYADILAPDTWIGSMTISHNGEMQAITTESGIWLIPTGEGEPVKILSNTKYPDDGFGLCQFSADDSELWYTRVYSGDNTLYRLEYINIATGEHSVFADNAIMAKWSGNGKYIYFYRMDEDASSFLAGLHPYILVRYDTATGTIDDVINAEEMTLSYRTPEYSVSTDGSYVTAPYNQTYIKDYTPIHNLYRYNVGGTKEQITFFNIGAIGYSEHSPEGQYILYNHSYHLTLETETVHFNALLVYHIESKKHYVVINWQTNDSIIGATWSHDGSEIWYRPSVSTQVNVIDFNPDKLEKLHSFDLYTVLLYQGDQYGDYSEEIRPTISVNVPPSGKIEFSTQWNDKIPSGMNLVNAFDWYLERGQQYPLYTPDGSGIVFTDGTECAIWSLSLEDEKVDLVYIDAQRIKSEANNIDLITRGYFKQLLDYTPNGEEIIFREFVYDEEWGSFAVLDDAGELRETHELIPEIKAVNPKTHEGRTILTGAYELCYTPDGSKIVYAGFNKNRSANDPYSYQSGIIVRDLKTEQEIILSELGRSPVVSPDGSTVYYSAKINKYSTTSIYKVSIDGGEPVQMTTELNWYGPRISPDGKWLICSVTGDNGNGRDQWLRAINTDTGREYDYVPPYDYVKATECSFSSDGSKICYTLLEKYGTDDIGRQFKYIYTADFDPDNYFKPTAVTEKVPADFGITGVYPNPFNMSSTIEYMIPENAFVTLSVFNVMGQKVCDLISEIMPQGMYSVHWDGRDQNGMSVSSGIYFSHLKLGDKVNTKRMLLLK
ncbi:MAG: PD40 domain-containing protein [Candidatus Latescibacteria bacterium]|nr:PD40 domain-containing protein [Candidatus Latescibacterota bacterium]